MAQITIRNQTGTLFQLSLLGSVVSLNPNGQKQDSLTLNLDTFKEEDKVSIVKKAMSLRSIPGLKVEFSKDVNLSVGHAHTKTTSTVGQDVKLEERVNAMRADVKKKQHEDAMNKARFIREKAKANLKNKAAAAKEPGPIAKAVSRVAKAVTPKAPVEAAEAAPAPLGEEINTDANTPVGLDETPTEGIALTKESLEKQTEATLLDISKKLDLKVKDGASKDALVKAILAAV